VRLQARARQKSRRTSARLRASSASRQSRTSLTRSSILWAIDVMRAWYVALVVSRFLVLAASTFMQASSIVLAARDAPEGCSPLSPGAGSRPVPAQGVRGSRPPHKSAEGDGAPRGAQPSFSTRTFWARVAPLGAPSRRFLRRRAALLKLGCLSVPPFQGGRPSPAPSASSSRRVVVPASGAPAPPGSALLLRARPRAPARTPRAGATGSCPSRGSDGNGFNIL